MGLIFFSCIETSLSGTSDLGRCSFQVGTDYSWPSDVGQPDSFKLLTALSQQTAAIASTSTSAKSFLAVWCRADLSILSQRLRRHQFMSAPVAGVPGQSSAQCCLPPTDRPAPPVLSESEKYIHRLHHLSPCHKSLQNEINSMKIVSGMSSGVGSSRSFGIR